MMPYVTVKGPAVLVLVTLATAGVWKIGEVAIQTYGKFTRKKSLPAKPPIR